MKKAEGKAKKAQEKANAQAERSRASVSNSVISISYCTGFCIRVHITSVVIVITSVVIIQIKRFYRVSEVTSLPMCGQSVKLSEIAQP